MGSIFHVQIKSASFRDTGKTRRIKAIQIDITFAERVGAVA